MYSGDELAARRSELAGLAAAVRGREAPVYWSGLRGAARAVVGARLVEAHAGVPALFLAPTAKEADALLEDLRTALGEPPPEEGGRVRPYPRHDTGPYDRFSPQAFVTAQRMDVLHRLLAATGGDGSEAPPVVVAPWTALLLRVPARSVVRERSVRLGVGDNIDRDALVATLVGAGYARQPLVEERGEIAVRGGIVDLFPPQRARPLRVELLGDEVESIREFDAASQRTEGKLDRMVAPPARELVAQRDVVVERGAALRALAEHQGLEPREVDALLDGLLRGHLPPGAEALSPLLQPALETLLDFLPADALVVIDRPGSGRERLREYALEILENHHAAVEAKRVVSPPDELFLAADALEAELEARAPVSLERLDLDAAAEGGHRTVRTHGQEELASRLRRARSGEAALAPLVDAVTGWTEEGWRVVLAAASLSSAERLRHLLGEYGVDAPVAREAAPCGRWSAPGRVQVRVGPLSAGFALPLEHLAVVTEEEIFGPRERRRHAPSLREGAAVEALAQLATGDLLVHAEHGIGIYRGLVMLEVAGLRSEMLRLEYAEGDRLFLPVHRLNLVQRYVGGEGPAPKIDRLGGATWERTKRTVKKSVRKLARELLAVHAARELAPGHSFSPRDRHLEEFEAGFPYEETPDQLAAIEDVLTDLTRTRPMDRLVCGDVGYGKTEVAIRAAFRAVMDGKQVAVLVPTTVLCQQHLETFQKRFEGQPVVVESLSRFRSPAEAKRVLEGLASGKVDVVIGTHRLLQKNVDFRDLGLLVVDEEHRFGVAHKERIKQLKQTVDVVTLTATPIPRTLQMAFTGLRDLSVINTPPPDRLAIRTQVCRFDESLVREAILREVRRGGQVFFVHNRVQTIGSIAELLARIVPEVSVIVGHGQMGERELEKRMLDFLHGRGDVLLCTTIIESGLDIPRANTIIVDRADALGLAQLYQLRGRVGRSSHRAYAYLLIPGEDAISRDAERRLEAIQDLSELGSGFRLANMDLEIRGAGNLLGEEQSGNLGAVGYETYMELLGETIDELRGEARPPAIDPEIRLPVHAQLPEDYVAEVSQRLVLYKRLASATDEADLARTRDELLDRYGPLPAPAENLVRVIRVKLAARQAGVTAVDLERGELSLTVGPYSCIEPAHLAGLVSGPGARLRVARDQRLRTAVPSREPEALLDFAQETLAALVSA